MLKELTKKAPNFQPVSIRIAYPWASTGSLTDPRWQFLRGCFETVLAEVQRHPGAGEGEHAFVFRLGRMRALHGADLLSSLVERCRQTDILGFDITGSNPNVMLELGIALATRGLGSGQVFIFREENGEGDETAPVPSDLNGYFLTKYTRFSPGSAGSDQPCAEAFQLEDKPGFRAALRSRLIDVARERGMWRPGVQEPGHEGDSPDNTDVKEISGADPNDPQSSP